MAKLLLIRSEIEKIPTPEMGKQIDYFDTKLTGFGVRASNTKKVYFVMSRANGKLERVSIGVHGALTPDEARKKAKDILGKHSTGIRVNNEKREAKTRGITLKKTLQEYLDTRPNLRAETKRSYESPVNIHLKAWLDKPMKDITGEMISRKHLEIAKTSGEAQANKTMRTLRLLFNFLAAKQDKPIDNPVKRLSRTRQWFESKRRNRIIQEPDLYAWYEALKLYSNPVIKDYLLLILFTGMREREGLSLTWDDVDMRAKTFTIRAEIAKNHNEHTLPMSNYIYDLFNRRLALRENNYVFPGYKENRPLTEVRRAIEFIIEKTELMWSMHDLRRTFSTIAEKVVNYATLKRLLNHSMNTDVTFSYLVITVDQLKQPMQDITNRIYKAISQKPKEQKKGELINLFG